ncbi:hypothetical protein CLV91_0904 [Maribacter vaceletii]|uniref:Uncharacterized protein n=1 Tax=Maribacter vaceletii TaxID=1206816 RepID=A0A495ED63_9FLAO|nr:hypothetical protein [Maribacter vaceletii]RKR14824.1 hypothetical protein CLV91_0904 [Maribacter vaceletii]
MGVQSNFKKDLQKEKELAVYLDSLYKTHLKKYTTQRVLNYKKQLQGIDVLFTHNETQETYKIDEKAQLDYIGEDLPTFAFEINYIKNDSLKKGWLFDTSKTTQFYALITAIYKDEPNKFTSCKITLVNRKKLIALLKSKKITQDVLCNYLENEHKTYGKIIIKELHNYREGYLYFSSKNKAESPLNLILKLDYLIQKGVAKRLI